MGKTYEQLDERTTAFIERQKMFFVATAPLSGDGLVNLSPKGYDSIRILGPKELIWIDLGGSGIETVAHLKENGRITLMFCAFEGPANIMRIYGRGEPVMMDDPGFDELLTMFPQFDRARSIIKVSIDRVMDSCGWGVPFYEFKEERDQLQRWAENTPIDEWKAHRYKSNVESLDGLPGLVRRETGGS